MLLLWVRFPLEGIKYCIFSFYQHAMNSDFVEKWEWNGSVLTGRSILTLGFQVPSTFRAMCGIQCE